MVKKKEKKPIKPETKDGENPAPKPPPTKK
jgi:hypothetical protein